MTADNEAREQALSVEIEKWRIDIDQPLQIRAVAKSWFRAGFDAALASRPAVPAATILPADPPVIVSQAGYEHVAGRVAVGELIAEARKMLADSEYLGSKIDRNQMIHALAAALESLSQTPEDRETGKLLYDTQAYLAKTLDNIEDDESKWAASDVREFITEALKFSGASE